MESVANNSGFMNSVFVAQTLGLLICVFPGFGRRRISIRDVICREPIRLAMLYPAGFRRRRDANPVFTDTSVGRLKDC